MEVLIKNSIKKARYFNSLNKTFYYYIWILYKNNKKCPTRDTIKGPLNSIIYKHFKINLNWSKGQRLNHTQMSTLKKKLFFFMFKSFITYYLIYLANGVISSEFSKNYKQISALGCLEIVANKKRHLSRKKNATR